MSFKKFFCLFSLIFVLSLGVAAEVKPPTLEHIFWKMSGWFNDTTPSVAGNFESPLFISFSVPPSPKSECVFFEFGSQSLLQWIPSVTQSFWSGYRFKFMSAAIPAGFTVENTTSLEWVSDQGFMRQGQFRTNKTSYKWAIVRDGFLENYVFRPLQIKDANGSYVPDKIANGILNDLLDSGFEVEITVVGYAQGVQNFILLSGWIDVTRSGKK
jgi:hypothetical protein